MKTREQQIRERRAQMPKLYRGTYDRAMSGKSRKAAMRAFCLECLVWQINEVFSCTDAACPLYPYRPAPRGTQSMRESNGDGAESAKGQRKGSA